ncbi:MAG: argininosuccinate lyase, partial [Actinobacteria bacterium]|nr:argininosuccinate lyase [Actinomycetota bacterium]
MNLWGGRFGAPPADALFALSRSIDFDWRLARYDIASSLAHLQSLVQEKIVSPGDAEVIGDALREISREIAAGKMEPDQTDEDVHSALERMLKEKVGEVGG